MPTSLTFFLCCSVDRRDWQCYIVTSTVKMRSVLPLLLFVSLAAAAFIEVIQNELDMRTICTPRFGSFWLNELHLLALPVLISRVFMQVSCASEASLQTYCVFAARCTVSLRFPRVLNFGRCTLNTQQHKHSYQ